MSRSATADTIRVEAPTRWDAVDLARRLRGLHTYLVQLSDRRWHVCVRCDGTADEVVPTVRAAAEEWAKDRGVASVLRVGGRTFEL